jgi:hypothetical protein
MTYRNRRRIEKALESVMRKYLFLVAAIVVAAGPVSATRLRLPQVPSQAPAAPAFEAATGRSGRSGRSGEVEEVKVEEVRKWRKWRVVRQLLHTTRGT